MFISSLLFCIFHESSASLAEVLSFFHGSIAFAVKGQNTALMRMVSKIIAIPQLCTHISGKTPATIKDPLAIPEKIQGQCFLQVVLKPHSIGRDLFGPIQYEISISLDSPGARMVFLSSTAVLNTVFPDVPSLLHHGDLKGMTAARK